MRPHSLGAARGRPALPVLRRLLSVLLATAVALLGLVAVSTSSAPLAHAADPEPIGNLLKPSIYNDPPKVGELALVHPGTWYPAPDSVTLEWFRSGSATPIGTGNAILVPFAARGETLTVKATATKAGYVDTVVSSAPSAPVADGTPVNYTAPAIFGTPEVGNTLAVWEGAWSVAADSYAYRWFQSGTAAPIATTKTLVVPPGAAGKELSVEVTVKVAGWRDGVATSDPVAAYAPGTSPVKNVVAPTISDAPQVGALAVAHPGVWDPQADSVDVEWFRSGSATPIGTGLTIVVPAAALGETLTVRASAHKAGRTDATATSAPSDAVGEGTLHPTEGPAIFGSPVVGSTVEAWPGAWFPAPDGYTYRWFLAGTVAPIGTGKTLVVPAGAAGKDLTVEVSAAKTAYADAAATSAPVAVAAAGPAPVRNVDEPSISGTLKVGATLTASTGTWDPADATTSVTWFRSGSTDPIGTGESLVVPVAAEGAMLSIVVKATKTGYADGYAVSAPQGPVLAAGATPSVQNLVAPAITDAPGVGQLVGVHPGVWNPAPDDVALQWFRSGSATPIGTGNYIVVPADAAGETLTVKATATKTGYASTTVASAPSDVVARGVLANTTKPVIYGAPVAGATVEAWPGAWSPAADSYSYRWLVAGTAIGNGKQLVIPVSAVGQALTVEVTATRTGYAATTATSVAVTPAQGVACTAAAGSLTSATEAQSQAAAAVTLAKAKVAKLRAKKKTAAKAGNRAKVAKLKARLRKARSARADAEAALASATQALTSAQAGATQYCP